MIKLGKTPYWFDGYNFSARDRLLPHEKERVIYADDHEPILRHLCGLAFGLNRWQGEADAEGEHWSVADHSILVAALAGRLTLLRNFDEGVAANAVRLGAVHDLGETLGLGDIAAPWLRGNDIVRMMLRRECYQHQRCASSLAGLHLPDLRDSALAVDILIGDDAQRLGDVLVKDADRLAAALERRVFFGDDSRDMEHPDAENLIAEFWGFMPKKTADNCLIHIQATARTKADALLDLILGRPGTSVKVLGVPMIADGKAVAP